MGLYDDRLADLEEARSKRVSAARIRPVRARSSTGVQSLLFERRSGWTVGKCKAWAKTHGYSTGKVDVTDQYVRVRQSDSQGNVKRTIPFGRGIRAVVAREGSSMAKVVKARRKKKKPATTKRPRRRAKTAKRAVRRKRRKPATVKAPRRKRRRAVRQVRQQVVQAKRTRKRRRRVAREATVVAAPRRKRRRHARRVKAWNGQPAAHAAAAKKGWRKRRAKKAASPKKRRASKRRSSKRKVSEATVVAAPRRRRHGRRKMRAATKVRTPRRVVRAANRGRRMFAPTSGRGMTAMELGTVVLTGTLGFLAADGLDRFLATYNPGGTTRPTDKFTSDGAGTLANTLNVAARPTWQRLAAGAGATALPAIGAVYAKKSPIARAALEGMALGAGISFVKTIFQNVLMPLLIGKDNSPAALRTNVIARLYPAEVAAHINQKVPQYTVSSAGASGALSGAPEQQLGVGDVGPFALSGDSPYPDAAQALRSQAGMADYPSLQNTWGTAGPGNDYPTAAQALRAATGIIGDGAWQPGPPAGVGPGPQAEPHKDASCGCIGDDNPFIGFVGDEVSDSPLLVGT